MYNFFIDVFFIDVDNITNIIRPIILYIRSPIQSSPLTPSIQTSGFLDFALSTITVLTHS